jgi:hypothetical protein
MKRKRCGGGGRPVAGIARGGDGMTCAFSSHDPTSCHMIPRHSSSVSCGALAGRRGSRHPPLVPHGLQLSTTPLPTSTPPHDSRSQRPHSKIIIVGNVAHARLVVQVAGSQPPDALFACLSATRQHYFSLRTNQPLVLFSQNKSAPAIRHQPNEQAASPAHNTTMWHS